MATNRVLSSTRFLSAGATLTVALLGLAGLTAPAAHADGIDGQFLSAIAAKDINFASPQAAILAAHRVCDEIDGGRAKGDTVNDVQSSSNLDGYHAGFFVGLSIAAYCPRNHQAP